LRATRGELEDELGRRWSSVREAYWCGHLGFPASVFADEQQELLLRALSSIHTRWTAGIERRDDLFGGDHAAWRFHLCWLASVRLLDMSGRTGPFEAPLSPEGRSVMLMLQVTREPAWEGMPFAEVVAAVVAASDGHRADERERTLDAFERQVGFRRHTFARESLGRFHLVTLTGIATDARMPTRRVTWSQPFRYAQARDELFAWLAQRVDAWDAWGEMAYRRGADAFTSHLLGLLVSSGGLAK
jgi:hypothetical protein